MVVQHNIPALNSYRNLGINNNNLSKNLEKLSSGYRINRAGDDAAGLAISEKMRGQIRGLGMAEQNAENGISLIQTAEGGLNETHDILQRMRELAVQSSNGTYQEEDRAQIELEYQALKSEIDRIASYTNYNGIRLLDGTIGGNKLSDAQEPGSPIAGASAAAIATTMGLAAGTGAVADGGTAIPVPTAPTSQVNHTTASLQTKLGALASGYDNAGAGDTGFTATWNGTAWTVTGGGNAGGSDRTTIAAVLNGTNLEGSAAGKTFTFDVDTAGNFSNVTVAATGDVIEPATAATTTPTAADTFKGSVNLSYNGTDWSASLGADFQVGVAAANVFTDGWTAGTYNNASGTLTVTNAQGASVNITIGVANSAALQGTPTNTDLLEGAYITVSNDGTGNNLQVDAASGYLNNPVQKPLTPDQIRINTQMENMGLKASSKFDLAFANDAAFQAALTTAMTGTGLEDVSTNLFDELNNQDAYIITRLSTDPAHRDEFGAAPQYETLLQVGDQTFLGKVNGANIDFYITNPNGQDFKVATLTDATLAKETGALRFNTGDITKTGTTYKSKLTEKENAIIGAENTAELVFQIGANGSEDQRIGMYVFNMSSNNLGNHEKGMFVSESSILTRDLANSAVETLDAAINYVSSQRANLGALQNRLEHTLNNLGVTKENLTAAESSIRDTDMAEEMMEFTKNNILAQASQAMLAQANQLPQGVLQLLR